MVPVILVLYGKMAARSVTATGFLDSRTMMIRCVFWRGLNSHSDGMIQVMLSVLDTDIRILSELSVFNSSHRNWSEIIIILIVLILCISDNFR